MPPLHVLLDAALLGVRWPLAAAAARPAIAAALRFGMRPPTATGAATVTGAPAAARSVAAMRAAGVRASAAMCAAA
eukprot:65863-Chlamydomonas_euryale.AAC.4